jgi:hypothetical protein
MSLHNSFAPTAAAEIERALSFIPADIARDDWIKIGAALKSEGDYFELFNQWSSNADNYNSKDCQAQWKSFKHGIINIGTLFHYAKQNGYVAEKSDIKPDYQAIAKRKAESQAKAAEQAKATAIAQTTAAKQCADIFATATDAPANHPYLLRKQIPAIGGVKVDSKNNLLIPVFNSANQIISIQTISPDGKKLFTKDSQTKGGFLLIGEIYTDCPIRIAEGYSKAVRSYLSNEEPVFIAFSKQNLAAVALMVRNQYPSHDIIINADNDHLNAKNVGLIAANEAAKLINGFVCIPHCKGSDFDDVFLELGREETVNQLSVYDNPNATESVAVDYPMTNDYPPDYFSHDAEQSYYQDNATNSKKDFTALDTTHNATLDTENNYCTVDLLQHVDNTHLLKRLSISAGKAMDLPPNTVFLMGLGIFSAIAARRYRVNYQDDFDSLPIGLYVVAEQPSGTGKSRCLKLFQKPFFKAEKEFTDTRKKAIADLEQQLLDCAEEDAKKSLSAELRKLKDNVYTPLFTTNSTPEAMEENLKHSCGYFAAISSEQGLFNSLLGKMYNDNGANNNDLLLNGFDGGYIASSRVKRDGYRGDVIGAAVMFAQHGSIDTILSSSNGTGLSERFLFMVEPHKLGKRDFNNQHGIHPEPIAKYDAIAGDLANTVLKEQLKPDDLCTLTISDNGFKRINDFRNEIEERLADGGRYSHVSLRGAAAKIDMQIMKIAANLHLLDAGQHQPVIDDNHVIAAINIAYEMIESNFKILNAKGMIGAKAEYTAILTLFENNAAPRTERNIVGAKIKTEPFKSHTGIKSSLVKQTLKDMVKAKVLRAWVTAEGISMYELAQ